jgi:hypothetical protein
VEMDAKTSRRAPRSTWEVQSTLCLVLIFPSINQSKCVWVQVCMYVWGKKCSNWCEEHFGGVMKHNHFTLHINQFPVAYPGLLNFNSVLWNNYYHLLSPEHLITVYILCF